MAQKIHTTANGDVAGTNNLGFSFNFPTLSSSEIYVQVGTGANIVAKSTPTHYTIVNYAEDGSSNGTMHILFNNSTARGSGNVRIFRETNASTLRHTFQPASAIRSQDLNENQKQALNLAEEARELVNNLALGDNQSAIQLNGVNIATGSVNSDALINGTIQTHDIGNGQITGDKLKSSSSTDSDRAVTTNHIRDGAVTDAKVSNIDGSKVTPNFGSQNIETTGTVRAYGGVVNIQGTTPGLWLTDTDDNPDYRILNTGGQFRVRDNTNSVNRLTIDSSDGHVDVAGNLDVGAGIDCTGTCAATTFSGSGASLTNLPSSALTGALPAIDGSSLLGVGVSVKRIKLASNTSTTTYANNANWENHFQLNFTNVPSTSRFLLIAQYVINGEAAGGTFSPGGSAQVKLVSSAGNLVNNTTNEAGGTATRFNHFELDANTSTANRQFSLQIHNTNDNRDSQIDNSYLIAIEFTPV